MAIRINFFDTAYSTEKQRESTVYTEPIQANIAPFFLDY
jgi:hypothetical protein